MSGFGILLRKELVEAWRTLRLPIVGGLFLLVGLTSPLLARYLPEIVEAAAGDSLPPIPLPTPTVADAVDQLSRNLAQFGALAAILLAMGSVATELDRGTAAFVLSRPVDRGAFIGAKAVAISIVLALAVGLAIAAGWLYTTLLFEPLPITGWIALGVLSWLTLLAWAALTFLAGIVTGSVAAAAGLGLVALLVLSIASAIPGVERFVPAGLGAPAQALATGNASLGDLGASLWTPVIATLAIVAGCVAASMLAFGRREL